MDKKEFSCGCFALTTGVQAGQLSIAAESDKNHLGATHFESASLLLSLNK
jgi:hydroxymethylglutaryl-CoA reductase